MASCCNEWEHVFDVEGGAVAVNEGVVRHDYDVVTGFWQSTALILIAAAISIAIVIVVVLTNEYLAILAFACPPLFIWMTSGAVTKVERTEAAFLFSTECAKDQVVLLSDVVCVAYSSRPACGRARPGAVRIETSNQRSSGCGKKSFEFQLEDVDAFVRENFRRVTSN
mmetsp:Transcript_4457/g.13418  ORF Transcript_4457/g.13418 Transcript_4457/m.13418 type:complete len:168 (-) Transcript_4457:70-573(-)